VGGARLFSSFLVSCSFLGGWGLLFFSLFRFCLLFFCVFFVPFFLLFWCFFRFLLLRSVVVRPFFCGLFFFFFLLVVVSVPFSVSSRVALVLRSRSSFGFCGSRSLVPPASVWSCVLSSVPAVASVSCGCVGGLCALARSSFPSASVFSVGAFGRGRGAFASRSVALVRSVASSPRPLWVSFPARSCPAGLLPSASPSRCFRGLGSGSWASLAFALGSGVPALLWLPAGVVPPVGWGFVPLGSGFWFASPPRSLF